MSFKKISKEFSCKIYIVSGVGWTSYRGNRKSRRVCLQNFRMIFVFFFNGTIHMYSDEYVGNCTMNSLI